MPATISVRLLTVAVMLLACAGIGGLAPASACACGGVANAPGGQASISEETAVAGWDGRRETIIMRLALRSGSDNAALIVPTPTPATVTSGTTATFTELQALTTPRIVVERRWFGSDSADGAASSGGSPTVLNRVQLGPLEATTLSGGDLTGIRKWLSDNGYEMRPEVLATLEPYLREGWSFVAMRLTGAQPLDGALDPVRLSFDSDRFVYPMRMSSAAKQAQRVHLYLLSDHRLRRSDTGTNGQTTDVDFAGRIADPTDPDLQQLTDGGRTYLTEMLVFLGRPADITTDFTFEPAATDAEVHPVLYRSENVEFFGLPGGLVILGAAAIAAFGVVIALIRVIRSPQGREAEQ